MSVWQSCRFSGRLLEDNAVLVLDERVLQLAVAPAVADAVVLDLDDDGADFAMREVDLRGQASWMGLAGFDVRSEMVSAAFKVPCSREKAAASSNWQPSRCPIHPSSSHLRA